MIDVIAHAKEISALVKKVGDMDLYQKIVELQGEIVDLSGQRMQLAARVRDLEEQINARKSLTRRDGGFIDDQGEPVCALCWEKDGKIVHILRSGTMFQCPCCQSIFDKKHGEWTLGGASPYCD